MKAFKRFSLCAAVSILTAVPHLLAQATQASLDGTYTFLFSNMSDYSPAFNMNGQQVGFCDGITPIGYNCGYTVTFGVIRGTLVADGRGNITSGAFTQTNDPNSYECSPGNNPTSTCPVKVPSRNSYSSNESYAVGSVVDFIGLTNVGPVTRTFQAVRASKGKRPDWLNTKDLENVCNNSNLNTCYWVQIPASLTNTEGASQSANVVGTYTVSANGSGMLYLRLANCTTSCAIGQFAMVVPPGNSTVGQTVHVSGESQLGNHNKCVGGATRVK
ncbi:MAG TPA: hypothetical protein VKB38_07165 [Terracidiphilus sp.]|nr:hypothetical protein [Terracidiphilus sp.]